MENISPIAQTTASTRTSTSSDSTIRPTEMPPSNHAQARNGSALARNASEIAHAASSLPSAMSQGVSSVVCSVARTPCSRSPLTEVAVSEGTMSMARPSTKKMTMSYIASPERRSGSLVAQ